jgi:hypothetical protein
VKGDMTGGVLRERGSFIFLGGEDSSMEDFSVETSGVRSLALGVFGESEAVGFPQPSESRSGVSAAAQRRAASFSSPVGAHVTQGGRANGRLL